MGIPAARFLHVEHGLPGYPDRSVIVNSYVEGEPLKQLMAAGSFEDSLESILPEVGRLLGYLHQVKVSGFGRLDGNGNGPFRTWREAYLDQLDLERLRNAVENVELPWPRVEEGIGLLEGNVDMGARLHPRLRHGDFGF